jgi:hypothetical protein
MSSETSKHVFVCCICESLCAFPILGWWFRHWTSTRYRTLQLPWGRLRRLGPLRRWGYPGIFVGATEGSWDINWGVLDVWYGLIIDPRFLAGECWWCISCYMSHVDPCCTCWSLGWV